MVIMDMRGERGTMAFNKKNKKTSEAKLLLSENSSFLMKEDYKTLRTNIAFSFPDDEPKIIAVTSSGRSEGKSTNSINLAVSFSELGKKVLLLDCDLRLPTVAAKLKINKKVGQEGLTDLLIGKATATDVLYHDEKRGIFVIGAGTIPPDPTKLLQSERMANLLTSLKKAFDYIILDCPPVTEVIDAALMSQYVDGYVLIVRHGESYHRRINEMLNQLLRVNAKILGFVYVNLPAEDRKYYKKGGGNYYQSSGK